MSATPNDGDTLLRAILNEPHDDLHLLAYADWLEEREERTEKRDLHRALRWMVGRKKRPLERTDRTAWRFVWMREQRGGRLTMVRMRRKHPECVLPAPLYDQMFDTSRTSACVAHRTWLDAVENLAAALGWLRDMVQPTPGVGR